MLGPSKPVPRIGAQAVIVHFGGRAEQVTIVGVEDDGRRILVSATGGGRSAFTLRRATAAFVEDGQQHAPRLRLL